MRLENFEVQSCCYCISLRTGTKIFGFISLLGCILAITFSLWEIVVVANEQKYIDILMTLEVIILTVQIITSVFLLLGAYQEKSKFIPPWLVATLICAVLEVVLTLSLPRGNVGTHDDATFTEWLIITIFLLYDIYGLLVVFSYYRTLTLQRQDSVM